MTNAEPPGSLPPAFAGHGWLPAVLPADATRFRVTDPDLAYTLREAGAELVAADPHGEKRGARWSSGAARREVPRRSTVPCMPPRQRTDRCDRRFRGPRPGPWCCSAIG